MLKAELIIKKVYNVNTPHNISIPKQNLPSC